MRSRNIKPGFFRNEDLARLGPSAMLLFEGLWLIADRAGCLEYRPERIKADLFPYTSMDVETELDKLGTAGFIQVYELSEGSKPIAIEVVNFTKHQNPHKNERPSDLKPILEAETGNRVQVRYKNGTCTLQELYKSC